MFLLIQHIVMGYRYPIETLIETINNHCLHSIYRESKDVYMLLFAFNTSSFGVEEFRYNYDELTNEITNAIMLVGIDVDKIDIGQRVRSSFHYLNAR